MGTFLKFMIICFSCYARVSVVNTWNIPIPDPINEPIHVINEVTVKLLTRCYVDHKEIVIHSDMNKLSIKSIQDTGSLATIMSSNSPTSNRFNRLRLHKNLFVMTPSSISQHKQILATFKNTTHWNIKAPFFILDNSNKQCKNAQTVLKATWKMNVIKSFFLCVDDKLRPMIYTYNPYTNRATQSWKQVGKSSSGWTMYSRPSGNKNMCAGLNFARTEHLDGAVIHIGVGLFDYTNLDQNKIYDESIMHRMFGDMAFLATKMKRFFNATLVFTIGPNRKLYECVNIGSCDVSLMLSIDESTSYTARYEHYYIVSNYRNSYIALNKIQRYYGAMAILLMCIVCLITFLNFLITGCRRRWVFAGVELLRYLINKSLYTRIDRMALKIFFCSVLLYIIAMQAIFFGNLSAVLTQRQLQNYPETMEDLKDPRYDPIHISWVVKRFIDDPILQRKIEVGPRSCISKLLENESAVCIYFLPKKMESVLRSKFHVSKRPVYEAKNYNPHREDWPLLDRFNKFLKSLESSGYYLADFRTDGELRRAIDALEETPRSSRIHFSPISISMLTWSFILLLIGLVVAIIFWACERRRKNITRIKMEPPKQRSKIRMKRCIARNKNELNQIEVAK